MSGGQVNAEDHYVALDLNRSNRKFGLNMRVSAPNHPHG